MNYSQGQTAEKLYEAHCKWEEQHAQTFLLSWPVHHNSPDPERLLRVGFVSPDLGYHPVGYFVVGLFEKLGKFNIEIVCYSDRKPDELTERIRATTNAWNDTRRLSHNDLANKILSDKIDVLFDLTGHSANNRLLAFARKPAPIQVSWAGYVATTGLSALDYFMSDIISTPKSDECFYREIVIRMPDSWLCYTPPHYTPNIGLLPYDMNGYITFCSFSNPAKINDDVLSLWSKLIASLSNSKLLIKYTGIDSDSNTKRLKDSFKKVGGDPSKLILEGGSSHIDLLARYNDVDIALDPFPYSGGLTTVEALWMGVPVITLPGETFASRHSASYLSSLDLPELIAANQTEYVEWAVNLASDTNKLSDLRSNLRERMLNSPICNYEKFAQDFANIVRDIWRNWCHKS